MDVIYSQTHARHAPREFLLRGNFAPMAETTARAENLVTAARAAGHKVSAPDDWGMAPVAAVHAVDYLEFLETGHQRWMELPGANAEIHPHSNPGRHMRARPEGIAGQVGFYIGDLSAPMVAGTWPASLASAHAAVQATELVLGGSPVAYALCRPPGHHAFADQAAGFCFINNVAVAAQHARGKAGRVAILDIDVHHGNGTQGIFWDRKDVFFCSLHADPSTFYPYYAGYHGESGGGAGAGYTLNLPLPHGTADADYMPALDRALAAINRFDPDVVLISLGFDAYEKDPLGVLKISTDGFAAMARRIAALGRPTVLVQEGGYHVDDLGRNLVAFLSAFETTIGGSRERR
ncbi:acetoin utilization deacetylase AcuC-like enzyme [Stella humosa]|uniref:Acetoin utilization deacetylase AcuC-like enzyme n=1 Tax=Stella humosa TaxID=94 RepID=A0A3N1MFS2_9PROT|nr:histone deacetylase family protein [Stella humosa]ROQ01520.1 acetoin utilization deacetylase AcuC-like enzyme [Stella humosa]BBK31899.1 acetylpolyamine amidohydrolase [Stella humosa]